MEDRTNTENVILSRADTQVVECILDPEAVASSVVVIDDALPQDQHIRSPVILAGLQAQEKAAIADIETAVEQPLFLAAASAAITQALVTFSGLITTHPTYASAYANRAQCLRLQASLQLLPPCTSSATQAAVLMDLSEAIRLAIPLDGPAAPVSRTAARTLASAYTQRATVYLGISKAVLAGDLDACGLEEHALSHEKAAEHYEELASMDFFEGGRYGNELAKAMTVRTNPYAKMCGSIVQEAMRSEMGIKT